MSEEPTSLLPEADAVIRCAPHARSHGYDPGGTAIAAATVLVAELPPPWPRPVLAHPALDGLSSTTATPLGIARILAAVPPDGDDRLRIHRFDRSPDGAFVTTYAADDVQTLRQIIDGALTAERLPTSAAPLTSRVVLVCTQGTHDVCCGIDGTRLAMALEANAWRTVMRVSHTGGHRFAPTALTLPDGRMWANLDVPKLNAILSRSLPPPEAAAMCRGWWGAAPGPAQVAERAVFAEVGWTWDDMVRRVAPVDDAGTEAWWTVTGNGAEWRVRTEPVRRVPVMSCRAPGGLPAKTATEYTATVVERP